MVLSPSSLAGSVVTGLGEKLVPSVTSEKKYTVDVEISFCLLSSLGFWCWKTFKKILQNWDLEEPDDDANEDKMDVGYNDYKKH